MSALLGRASGRELSTAAVARVYLTKLPRSSRPTMRCMRGRLINLVGFLTASSKRESISHCSVSSAQHRTA